MTSTKSAGVYNVDFRVANSRFTDQNKFLIQLFRSDLLVEVRIDLELSHYLRGQLPGTFLTTTSPTCNSVKAGTKSNIRISSHSQYFVWRLLINVLRNEHAIGAYARALCDAACYFLKGLYTAQC